MKPAHQKEEDALGLGYGTSRGRRRQPPPPPPASTLLYHHPTLSFAASSRLSPKPPIKTTSSNHHVPRPPPGSSSSFSLEERGTIATTRPPVALSTSTGPSPPPPRRVTMTNPSQMPSIPSATEPNNQPCILYSTISSTGTTTTSSSMQQQEEIQRPPPPPCSRYIVQDRGNASPRLLQCTTQTLPRNKYVAEKTGLGRLNMGMLCMPLAVPSQDYDNDFCLDKECSHDDGKRHDINHAVEYVPLIWDKDTEEHFDQEKGRTGAEVNPIRCKYCKAYWNPFVTLSEEKSSTTGNGSSRRTGVVDYICNFCERTNTVSLPEMQGRQSSEFYTLPLTHGTVEYEVGGEYLHLPRQKDRHQQQAEGEIRDVDMDMDMDMDNLIGNERRGMTFLFALDGGDWDKFLLYLKVLEYIIEDVKKFWIRQRNLEREILERVTTDSYKSPRIGFFVHVQDHVLIPYWQKKRIVNDGSGKEEDNCWELSVTLMTDVKDEPFSPLPLSMWTFSLLEDCEVMPQTRQHCNEIPLSKLYETLKRIPAILRQMIPDYQCRSSITTPFSAARGECNSWNCGGAALKILSDALCSCGGGRGTLMTSSLFNHGVGALYDRQGSTNTKYVNASTEKSLFVPYQKNGSHSESGSFHSRLAVKCVEGGVSLNIMISSPLGPEVDSGIFEKQYLDLATMGEICRHTCGKLRWLKYEDCDFQLDFSIAVEREGCYAHRLKNELLNLLCVYTGQRALFKMRCSSGVRIISFLPKCKVPGEVRDVGFSDSPELVLPCVEPDTCIAVELDHRVGGIPKRKNMNDNQTEEAAILYIQTALLYTNPLGRRRVRVSTLALKATESIPEIYCTANFDTLAAFMVRLAISDLMDSPSQKKASLAMARQEIVNRCIQILTNYGKYGNISTAKQGQLILPETLQLLPLFCLSLLKSRLFRPSLSSNPSSMCKPSPTADERAFHLFHCSNICPSMAMLVVHPRVYDLNNLSPNVGEPVLPESHSSMMSSFYNVSSSSYTYDQDPFVFRAANEPYIQLPPLLKPSVSCISDGGLYLIDNGFQFVLFCFRS